MIVRERLAPRAAVPASGGEGLLGETGVAISLRAVLAPLPLIALAELLLMRVFYRVGIYLPRTGPFGTVHRALTSLGSFAFNLASVLTVVALVLLIANAARRGRPRAAFALGAFLLASALVRLAGVQTLGPSARLTFVLAVVALVAPFLRGRAHPAHRIGVAGVAGVALLSSYAGLVTDGGRLAMIQPVGVVGAQLAAELVLVAASFTLLEAWIATDGFRIGPVLLTAPAAVVLMAAWWANGAVTGILALWAAGLRLYLPVWLYALALWALVAAAVGWLPRHAWRSAGLALLPVAGMLLGSTYLQALLLVALALLTDGEAVGGLPNVRARSRAWGSAAQASPSSRVRRATKSPSASSIAGSTPGSS